MDNEISDSGPDDRGLDDAPGPPTGSSDGRMPWRFGPDRRLSAAYVGAALIAVAAAFLTSDRAGRLMFAIAALVLTAYAVTDFVYWPRLVAGRSGLVVHTPTLRGSFGWDQVESVRADSRQRLGLRLVTLEVDVAETLVIFSRRALGTDPERAAELIRAAAAHG